MFYSESDTSLFKIGFLKRAEVTSVSSLSVMMRKGMMAERRPSVSDSDINVHSWKKHTVLCRNQRL